MHAGSSIAEILAGSWRKIPPPLETPPPFLSHASQTLLKTGASGLALRRLSKADFNDLPDVVQLRQAYRLHILQAAIHQQETVQAFNYLRSTGVEPVLGKGWAIARLYPERGLRPYGDIDLFMRPEEFRRAKKALLDPSAPALAIDLQNGCRDLKEDRTMDQVYERSQLVRLGDVDIRVLGIEDHLRLLCIHLLGNGAFRPLWLCDVAVVMESLPESFDWDYFLSGDRRRTDWVACTMGLAHAVLGANLGDWPVSARARNLPRWLIPALLKQWSAHEFYSVDFIPLSAHLRQPAQAFHALRLRWPSPIQASIELGAPFNEMPRLPLQIADTVRRAFLFAFQTSRNRKK
jgi:hypothetical protein